MGHVGRNFRLTNELGGLGLRCTESGLSLAGVPLLSKSATGFAPRPAAEIEALVRAAYGEQVKAGDLLPGIAVVARALNNGDVARAMIAAVLTKTSELGWDAAARLAHADERLCKYSPDEPRDEHGRWTTGDGEEDESASPDNRSPLERKYDDLGPVEFAKQVIQFGWNLGVAGQGFTPEQRQDALAEYKFLQDRLNFWLAYDDKPMEAQSNLVSAALNLYTGAVNGGIVPVGGKGGDLPASMLVVATGILAADNGAPGVRLRGPDGGAEVEPEPVPLEHEPAPPEEVSVPGELAPWGPSRIIAELTRTGELGEIISNDEAKIGWDTGTDKGIDWENYNQARYPDLTRLNTTSKTFDFFDDASGEAISDKSLDPLCYSYINEPQRVYRTVKGYIDAAANYNRQRVKSDVDPTTINSRYFRLAVRNYISPAQWENLYRAVRYARSRGVRMKIWRVD